MGKAQLDADAAGLFFRKPIGIDPRQQAHQRGLAVVDVAGRADDERRSLEREAASAG